MIKAMRKIIKPGLTLAAVFMFMGASADTAEETQATTASAIFAGGCFWCMEPPYDTIDGVISTTSGYIGGMQRNPSYERVSSGRTGHTEAVEVVYDPSKVTYQELLDIFWVNIDPFAKNRQFCDRGAQYRSGIFYLNEEQQTLATASKEAVQAQFEQQVVTEVTAATEFWPAEDYHQDYYMKNPLRYKYYRFSCGRDQRLEEIWGS